MLQTLVSVFTPLVKVPGLQVVNQAHVVDLVEGLELVRVKAADRHRIEVGLRLVSRMPLLYSQSFRALR